jgi:hypothetical protein
MVVRPAPPIDARDGPLNESGRGQRQGDAHDQRELLHGICIYTGEEARVPDGKYYDSSAMTPLAYAARRTIGAVIVFLIVVMLTMFAVGSVGLAGWSPENGPIPDFVNPWYQPWASFPMHALTAVGLAAVGAIVWPLAARRR